MSSRVNRLVAWILRSPFSGLLEGSVMLITVRGRRTGRELTLPVQYADAGEAIWVLVGHPERKKWWRNLEAETGIGLRLRGVNLSGTARAFSGEKDESNVEAGLRAYLRRFPRSAPPEEGIEEVARRTVIVRILPHREREAEADQF